MAIPIPHRSSGFTLGPADADVKVDAFIDLQCPHSKKVWPNLITLLEYYKDAAVSVTVHIITLSNHRQAWDVSLGVFALAKSDAKKAFDFITYLYLNQDQYYNGPFLNKTQNDLHNLIADFAVDFDKVDRDLFLSDMKEHDVYINGRTPIRYAATKSVWATPTLFINNADDVPVNHESDLDAWREVVDPLLGW